MKLYIRFLLVFHIFLIACLGMIFFNSIITPSKASWINFFSLVFPLLFVVHLVLIAVWIFVYRKMVWYFLLISIIFVLPAKRWISFSFPTKKTQQSIKIITLNANSGIRGEDKLKDFINRENPDIVFFQESRFYKSEILKLQNLAHQSKCFYIQTFTKMPIHKEGAIVDEPDFWGESLYCDVEINGKKIRLINVYLETFLFEDKNQQKGKIAKMKENFKKHEIQIKKIVAAIKNSPYPIILSGDFNAVPNSYEYYAINKVLNDAFLAAGNGSATTFNLSGFPLRIDYIFTSKSIKPTSYKVYRESELSDHNPIVAEFEIH